MHLTWITLLTFATTSLLVMSVVAIIYDAFFRYRVELRQRVIELTGEGKTNSSISLFKEFKQLRRSETVTYRESLQQLIDQSGVAVSVSAILVTTAMLGVVLAGLGAIYSWGTAALLLFSGFLLPYSFLYVRRMHRQHKLCKQLPEAFAMISRAVKAGQTIPAAMKIIAEDFESPISTEFALCYEQENLGISRETALRKLAARSGIMDLQMFVIALLVQGRSGGDLAEMLDNLALMIRKRMKLRERVRALTGEGRMQALVLILLPVAALVGLIVLSPEYAQELLDRPWLLGATAIAQLVGALWIRAIVNFEY